MLGKSRQLFVSADHLKMLPSKRVNSESRKFLTVQCSGESSRRASVNNMSVKLTNQVLI